MLYIERLMCTVNSLLVLVMECYVEKFKDFKQGYKIIFATP